MDANRRDGAVGRSITSWILLIGFVTGVCVAMQLASLPSPALFGSLVGGLVFSLTSRRTVTFPSRGFLIGQAIIGVTVGSSVDWGTLRDLGPDGPAVIAVCLATLALSIGAGQLLRLHRGVSVATASFSSVAGGASGMTAIARDFGADDRIVTVIQYLRVLVILMVMPIVVATVFGADAGDGSISAAAGTTVINTVFAAGAVAFGLLLGKALHLPSPGVIGGLIGAVLLALLPIFHGVEIPGWVKGIGFVLIGVQVGLRFTPESMKAIGRMLPTAVVALCIVIGACGLFGAGLAYATGVSPLDAYLATTPGGLPAVLAASSATDGNLTFVTATQLLRLLLVLGLAPFVPRLFGGRQPHSPP